MAAATTGQEIDQVVRSFLLYLLGTTLFADTASSLDLIFMMPLRDLDVITSFDWGSCALAYLYRSMDDTTRRARRFYGFWHAVLAGSPTLLLFVLISFNNHDDFSLVFPLQVWALEMELIIGIFRVFDVHFPSVIRWGASRAWKRDLL